MFLQYYSKIFSQYLVFKLTKRFEKVFMILFYIKYYMVTEYFKSNSTIFLIKYFTGNLQIFSIYYINIFILRCGDIIIYYAVRRYAQYNNIVRRIIQCLIFVSRLFAFENENF